MEFPQWGDVMPRRVSQDEVDDMSKSQNTQIQKPMTAEQMKKKLGINKRCKGLSVWINNSLLNMFATAKKDFVVVSVKAIIDQGWSITQFENEMEKLGYVLTRPTFYLINISLPDD